MARWFYHPLGEYAQKYIDNITTASQKPHTRTNHGFNKIDYGVGGNLKVYSMTSGVVSTAKYADDESKYVMIIKCVDNGYSEMMGKLRGQKPENFPIYISYIEMSKIEDFKSGDSVSPGTLLGYTNSVYEGSNVHIDIGAYDRYGVKNTDNPNLITHNNSDQLAIGMDRWDAYGDKGENYQLKDYLTNVFTLQNNNIYDTTKKPIGTLYQDGLYYPIGADGSPILYQTVGIYPHYNTSTTPCPINRFYHYALAMQTPVYKELKRSDNQSDRYDGNVDIRNYITYTERERQAALGVISFEAGSSAPNCSLESWGRVLRNRICQGYSNNLEICARMWLGDGQSYGAQDAINYYNNIFLKYSKEQQDIVWNTLCGNNYHYIETAVQSGSSGGFENTKYGNYNYLYNFNMLFAYHWWSPPNLVAWVEGMNGRISSGYAPDVNTNNKIFNCPEWLKNGI